MILPFKAIPPKCAFPPCSGVHGSVVKYHRTVLRYSIASIALTYISHHTITSRHGHYHHDLEGPVAYHGTRRYHHLASNRSMSRPDSQRRTPESHVTCYISGKSSAFSVQHSVIRGSVSSVPNQGTFIELYYPLKCSITP